MRSMYWCQQIRQAIIKQYYEEVLIKELTNNSGASTYVRCNEHADKVVESHLQLMSNNDTEESRKLPSFYWMPKLQKVLIVIGL